ncbi:hypothetical protein AVEN_93477-1 [Araneus ventricosus]|uniref:Uncharacterized protein n=1 Tax=Araneus ventricosus TaxID=182803 RepID=A0A4Y2AR19_ARAVE|nr:hypothetical protein AVEN_93477-1 [Araneus ventricosus]
MKGSGDLVVGFRFKAGLFQVRNPIPLKTHRVWGLLYVKSYLVAKRPPAGVMRKAGEVIQLRRRPRHLIAVQNYKVRPKIAFMLLRNGTLCN